MRKFVVLLLIVMAGCAAGREGVRPESHKTSEQATQQGAEQRPGTQPHEQSVQTATEPQPGAVAQEATHEKAPLQAHVSPVPGKTPREQLPVAKEAARSQENLETHVAPEKMERLSAFAALNDENLINIYIGMPQKKVKSIMGSFHRAGLLSNPYWQETIKSAAGQTYEIWFYLTREPLRKRMITERHVTPVIFKDEEVYAIGRYQLKKLRRSIDQAAPPNPRKLTIKKKLVQ